ncbi:MAG: hypothetical protein HC879_10445 [Leptolyngbyaceae cyanobacterium SL_5_9]|nr:hypothetical protein [Leptolyngbyaceae cyanobacterium SL_5_9]NJO74375.1 hypothetical protein [Leptolyngbyaceae cyanobacterium RM1_406_9]
MLPWILKALAFRCDKPQMQPVMDALELLKEYADKPHQESYAADKPVPMHGVLSPSWQ